MSTYLKNRCRSSCKQNELRYIDDCGRVFSSFQHCGVVILDDMIDGHYIKRDNYGYKWVIVSTIMTIKIAGSSPSGIQVSKKQSVSSSLTCKYLILWGTSVTKRPCLRPPALEFRVLCLEGSVISFISPYSGGSPGPV